MEAGDGYRQTTLRTVIWRGNWDLFKEEFGAAAEISGTSHAIELAEKLAKGEEMETLEEVDKHLVRTGLAESRRLKTQLTLSLITTEGAQQALLRSGPQNDKGGIGAWVRLVKHFDAPCREVERCWRGMRVNLNPAADGQGCDYERRVSRLGWYKLMFDFKDFNSVHTLASQKCVIRHLFKDLDPIWRSWLERSVGNMWIRGNDDMWFKAQGTLMSGHRMTSIINSILNAAYTRVASRGQ